MIMKTALFFLFGLLINVHTSKPQFSGLSTPAALQYVVRKPAGDAPNAPVLILLHGYGSHEHDLFSFADRIPNNWLVVSARGPFSQGDGYCWYHLKRENGKIVFDFQEEEKSRREILGLIDQIVTTYKADKNKVLLAGFSQGAAMSLCVGLTEPRKVAGFAMFSGRFVEEIRPLINSAPELSKKHCFIAHGSHDDVLPIQYALESREKLKSLNIPVMYSEDVTGHSISPKQFADFLRWLAQI